MHPYMGQTHIGMLINKVIWNEKTILQQVAYSYLPFQHCFCLRLFVIYPIFPELLISFQKNDGFRNMGYIGLENYIDVLNDKTFWRANFITLLIVFLSTL